MNKPWIAFHLQEALEELQRTLRELADDEFDEEELRVGLEHAYHHLNTAWNSRSESDERTAEGAEADFDRWRTFPTDLSLS